MEGRRAAADRVAGVAVDLRERLPEAAATVLLPAAAATGLPAALRRAAAVTALPAVRLPVATALPVALPRGGYGPPGGAPPGGYGPPGGAPPGGYGPPPGGGGYGPPPGGPGYGPPPGDYGAPPGGGGMQQLGQRVQFTGDGGKLLVLFLMWGLGPAFVASAGGGIFFAIGNAIDGGHASRHHGPGGLFFAMAAIGFLVYITVAILGGVMLRNKMVGFHAENTVIDGQRLRYTGTMMDLLKAMFVPALLTSLTMGIYTPWMLCRYWAFVSEHTEVNGQRGRLTFSGDGGTLLGKFIVGYILTACTCGIYGAWFANDIFAFYWENSKIDGRGFGFRKDPGGFLGTYILTAILSYCTLFIYLPWGLCNIVRWEYERVT